MSRPRGQGITLAFVVSVSLLGAASPALAQSPPAADTRAALLAAQKAGKARQLKSYEPNKAEIWVKKLEEQFLTGALHWHPFFDSAYAGGGFTLGAGYAHVRRAATTRSTCAAASRRAATCASRASSVAPRLFDRRGVALGPRRLARGDAGRVLRDRAPATPRSDDRANYGFRQPYGAATLDVRPARNWLVLGGGARVLAVGAAPRRGLGAVGRGGLHARDAARASAPRSPTCTRRRRRPPTGAPPPGYARRGGYYGVTVHDFADSDDLYGFQQVDYEAIQHVPLVRDAWVLSLHGRVETTYDKDGQAIPFFMLPALGGGSSLRGFSSWRFRDRHSLLLQAEWRVLVNSFFDTAIFYDAGKVTADTSDLDLNGLKKRLRHRLPPARPRGDPAAHRVRARATKGSPSCSRPTRRSEEPAP